MIKIRNQRKQRKVIELICSKLGIDDKELSAFINKSAPKEVKTVVEEVFFNVRDTVIKIEACESIEDLKEFESDERKTVITAYEKRAEELKEGE